MERTIIKDDKSNNDYNDYYYSHDILNEEKVQEELSCNQLLKNLLKTNLRLLKLNDIGTILLF